MTLSEWLQLGTLLVAVCAGLGIPIIIYNMRTQDQHRERVRLEMHERLTHLDECVDDLKIKVLGELASRAELVSIRSDTTEIINRQRIAISSEMTELGRRITRIEDFFMNRQKG